MSLNCVIIFIAYITVVSCGKCPAEEYKSLIMPCVCNEIKNEITCNTQNSTSSLKLAFDYLTQTLDWRVRHFHRLVINASELTQLEEITFHEVTFNQIFIINARKLQRINTNALGKTRGALKKLVIKGAQQLISTDGNNLFDVLSSMNNIHQIEVNGIDVNQVPDYAFRPLLGTQWNLTFIKLMGKLEKVGNYAFYDPSYWVRRISLGNQIKFIATHAFDMRTSSHFRLTIDLSDNQLSADSFESGVFLNSKRPILLNLTNNKLTHFDEFIFEPFLDLNIMNQIDIKGNPLVCDCRMKWLLKKRANYEKQVMNANCSDGKLFWSYTEDQINECKISDVIV